MRKLTVERPCPRCCGRVSTTAGATPSGPATLGPGGVGWVPCALPCQPPTKSPGGGDPFLLVFVIPQVGAALLTSPGGRFSRCPKSGRDARNKALGSGSRSSEGDRLWITFCLAESASELSTGRDGGLFSGVQTQMGKKLQALKDVRGAKQDVGRWPEQPRAGQGRRNGWSVVPRPHAGGSPGPPEGLCPGLSGPRPPG